MQLLRIEEFLVGLQGPTDTGLRIWRSLVPPPPSCWAVELVADKAWAHAGSDVGPARKCAYVPTAVRVAAVGRNSEDQGVGGGIWCLPSGK